ncbi:HigA family addiction module antitoxin [Candidatus Spyradosoma sp. SGI.093]|uniref:HigA family addiction module antitoxin n=1 Tax=Candidatus Spyradosoma sp. SGI.093 TaxID=3420583 RepID=UPI003D03E81A
MNRLKTPHPGAHLKELLDDLGVSNYRLAKASGIPATAIGQIIAGNRRITAETALRLAAALRMSPQFWMNAQTHFDLMRARESVKEAAARIVPLVPAAAA